MEKLGRRNNDVNLAGGNLHGSFSTVENFCGTGLLKHATFDLRVHPLNTAVPKGDRRCRKRPEAVPSSLHVATIDIQRISGTGLLNLGHLHPSYAKWPRSNYPRDRSGGGSIRRLLILVSLSLSRSLLRRILDFDVALARRRFCFDQSMIEINFKQFTFLHIRDENIFLGIYGKNLKSI